MNIGNIHINKKIIIITAVTIILLIISFIILFNNKKTYNGKWDCNDLKININKKEVSLELGSKKVTGNYTNPNAEANELKKKKGFTYKNYKVNYDDKGTIKTIGFSFGISKDGKKGHYIDGLNSANQISYECKKK